MKKTLFAILTLAAVALQAAEPKETAVNAAKALGDKANYSWTTTSKMANSQFNIGPIDGKTEKGGLTYLKGSFNDNDYEVLMQDGKVAMKSQDGWKGADELTEGPGSFMVRRYKTYKTPAQEAQDLVEKTKGLKEADGAISGDLTEDGVKSYMLLGGRRGGNAPEVSGAKGIAKFWVKDGVLSKYEYHVQGKISTQNGDRDVDRTVTVEIKNAGSTKVSVPDEAKKKLS